MNLIFKKIWNKSLGCCVVVSENTKNSGKGSQVTGSVQQPSKIASNIQLFKLKPLVVATGLSLISLVSQQVFAEQVITCGAQGSNNNPSIATAALNNTIISQQYWGTLYCLNQPSGTLVSDNKLLNDDLNVTISTDTLKVGAGGITSKGALGNDPGNGSISFNNNKITNLSNGISTNDAVNFGQLNSLANVFGGGAGFSGGVFTGPTYVIQGSNYTNIGSAFTAVNTKLTSLQSQIDGLPTGGGADGKSAYELAVVGGYVGTQTQWLASLKGDKGDKGDVGATGATGATGAQGDKGDKGDVGATGATGATGAQGPKGDKGDKGDIGATGATGAQGDKGDKGDVGATGATGATGDKGDKGDKGDVGATGATGATGDKGDKGD
ncbi:ESPR domain-containing protein, partial [Acinetobacter modestus]|uniref:ESPR domain-containing protein n=1 Tax=Acinetobacter modestus TaxID=1776740 RepID=UPI002547E685